MKLLSRKSITAATAVAVLGGLSIAAVPSEAASLVHHKAGATTTRPPRP
ncbi:hypothetical protein N7U49_42555 [Streptomyces sp. AD2-2]|nr:hypothetical protein N7U49_42555 [Streptomyces sp. AD2-2]